MRTHLMAVLLMMAAVSGAFAARRGPAWETPRATDLLRAERLAEEADGRRRLPPPGRRTPWKPGGGGFGDGGRGRTERGGGHVIINVRPPAKRRSAAD